MIVKVYSKPGCVQCQMTKRLLDNLKIEYEEIDAELNREYLAKQNIKTLPFVEARKWSWTGFRPDYIRELKEN